MRLPESLQEVTAPRQQIIQHIKPQPAVFTLGVLYRLSKINITCSFVRFRDAGMSNLFPLDILLASCFPLLAKLAGSSFIINRQILEWC